MPSRAVSFLIWSSVEGVRGTATRCMSIGLCVFKDFILVMLLGFNPFSFSPSIRSSGGV